MDNFALAVLASSFAILVAACGDDAAVESGGGGDTSVTPDVAADTGTAADSAPADTSPAEDTGPLGPLADITPNGGGDDDAAPTSPAITPPTPQPDAWAEQWARTLSDPEGRILGFRYLGGQSGAGLIAVFEAHGAAGDAALVGADGASEALPGEGRRLVLARLDPNDAEILSAEAVALAPDELIGNVTKGPDGIAVSIIDPAGAGDDAGPRSPRVVLVQGFGDALRVAVISIAGDGLGEARITLPSSSDLTMASTSGAATALALQLAATVAEPAAEDDAPPVLRVTVGEAVVDVPLALPFDGDAAVAFLSLPAPSEEALLPAEGAFLAVAEGLIAASVAETRLGPVVTASALVDSLVRDDKVVAGDEVLLVGAIPTATSDESDDGDGVVPVVLWSGIESAFEVVQISSVGFGGLMLAGVGSGELSFGDDTRELDGARAFVATLGSSGGFVYTAPDCDRIMAVSAGFQYRIVKHACDLEDVGPALVLTLLGSDDFSGELGEPVDVIMSPLAEGTSVTSLAGMINFTSSGERAYGGLFDLGDGPRIIAGRGDGQSYDSGVIEALAGYRADPDPLSFHLMRQGGGGGGGGGGNATNNHVIYAVSGPAGPALGRVLIDFKTYIW